MKKLFLPFSLFASAAFAGTPPNVGDKAPDFTAATDTGRVKLSDYAGQKRVVLYFYPKDFTPGCTAESCDFRDNIAGLGKLDTVVFGVSYDSIESHKKFVEHHKLTFGLIADMDHKVSEAYGVAKENVCSRATFIIGKDGKIAWRNLAVKPKEAVAEVRAALEQLNK